MLFNKSESILDGKLFIERLTHKAQKRKFNKQSAGGTFHSVVAVPIVKKLF